MKKHKGTEFHIFCEMRFQNFIASKFLSNLLHIRIKLLVIFFTVIVYNIWSPMSSMAQKDSVEVGFEDQNVDDSVDDVLSGFDNDQDESETTIYHESIAIEESSFSIYGSIGLSLSYSYIKELPEDNTYADWSGLTKVQPFISLKWDTKIGEKWKTRISGKIFYNFAYGLKERENFSKEVLNELEHEAELREFYIEGSPFRMLDIKFGNQIIVWGVSNSLRVIDVLNPIDNREFGMTDLEDTRLPINMTRIDYFIEDLKLEAVAIHEIKFNKSAPYGSDFNPATQKIDEVIPESTLENTEYGLALIGNFRGWDASLNWAQYFDDTAHFKISSTTIVPGVGLVPTYEMQHSRMTMVGMTLSILTGNYLWKAELAEFQGIEFALVTDKIFSRIDYLFGIEYYGLRDTSVSIEIMLQHLNDFDSRLEEFPDSALEDNYVSSVSFTQDYLNQTLHFNLSGMMIGESGREGGINGAYLEYEIVDALSLKGGVMIYQSGESKYFQSINENDRLFFQVMYSF